MKKSLKPTATLFAIILGWSLQGAAQTVQYVDLYSGASSQGANLPIQPNQLVSVVGGSTGATVTGFETNGVIFSISIGNGVFCGMTNINCQPGYNGVVYIPHSLILQITTPASANVISNYVPADAIVIPASATGNVQIILESSPDLVNWTAASPGTYGASAGTNRFFRVRAVYN
jgi:hypothetical protein